jgi:hypothetical protein
MSVVEVLSTRYREKDNRANQAEQYSEEEEYLNLTPNNR